MQQHDEDSSSCGKNNKISQKSAASEYRIVFQHKWLLEDHDNNHDCKQWARNEANGEEGQLGKRQVGGLEASCYLPTPDLK